MKFFIALLIFLLVWKAFGFIAAIIGIISVVGIALGILHLYLKSVGLNKGLFS